MKGQYEAVRRASKWAGLLIQVNVIPFFIFRPTNFLLAKTHKMIWQGRYTSLTNLQSECRLTLCWSNVWFKSIFRPHSIVHTIGSECRLTLCWSNVWFKSIFRPHSIVHTIGSEWRLTLCWSNVWFKSIFRPPSIVHTIGYWLCDCPILCVVWDCGKWYFIHKLHSFYINYAFCSRFVSDHYRNIKHCFYYCLHGFVLPVEMSAM